MMLSIVTGIELLLQQSAIAGKNDQPAYLPYKFTSYKQTKTALFIKIRINRTRPTTM